MQPASTAARGEHSHPARRAPAPAVTRFLLHPRVPVGVTGPQLLADLARYGLRLPEATTLLRGPSGRSLLCLPSVEAAQAVLVVKARLLRGSRQHSLSAFDPGLAPDHERRAWVLLLREADGDGALWPLL